MGSLSRAPRRQWAVLAAGTTGGMRTAAAHVANGPARCETGASASGPRQMHRRTSCPLRTSTGKNRARGLAQFFTPTRIGLLVAQCQRMHRLRSCAHERCADGEWRQRCDFGAAAAAGTCRRGLHRPASVCVRLGFGPLFQRMSHARSCWLAHGRAAKGCDQRQSSLTNVSPLGRVCCRTPGTSFASIPTRRLIPPTPTPLDASAAAN